ncbi:YdcF family protein [Paenibacillus sp. CGMCC 1.16610]|uniref:YdcF family protein n=1 Tax=Paenibacillus anseongense TaxID=2682845 RepID=A0ABW9UCS9_9BACL|nr:MULTISPECIES: YdcF family protein [Paenibacillus]MBA2944073.1 YdcF family protein [Paenibacillus sp. CGMCC 1.16610]MVQ37962.1 YdcF family protein [Paenibacillus anseongense]
MLYLIKIAYTLLFPPGIVILLLFCIALWLQQKKEYIGTLLIGLAVLLLYVCSMPYFSNELLNSIERRYTPPAQVSGDVIVMLTGGATLDTPDPLTKGEGYLTGNTAARVLTIAELYRSTKLPILLSGGQVFTDSGNESQISKRHLIALGVPEASIFLDDTSRNTEENALHTQAMLTANGWQHPILVTSAFHMARSVKQFQKLKVDVTPYPTDYISQGQQALGISKFIPSASGLSNTSIALKEYLGLLAAKN